MRLYHTPTSPFVRKVLVAAHELGLADRIETTFLRPTPTRLDPTLSRANPLSKIPALVLDDGSSLFDSRVICAYMETLSEGKRLVPAAGPGRFRVLRLEALADGILDAAILVFYERSMRPKELWWEPFLQGQADKARQGLDALEAEATSGALSGEVDLAQVSAAVTLGWLSFRGAVGDPLEGRPSLAAFYGSFSKRPSMLATAPPAA